MEYSGAGKRALDIVLAGLTLLVAAPVMVVVCLLVQLEDGGPALFRQVRIGRDGSPFTLLKFRSMPTTTAVLPSAAAGALQITRVGRFIRRTNLDELPQLWNILVGDMSVVGPRPALPVQEALLARRAASGAARIRPGLTGLAQISSYDGMPETEKAAFDALYATRITLLGDLSIVLRTFRYLLKPPPRY